jgi:hypothetical protein
VVPDYAEAFFAFEDVGGVEHCLDEVWVEGISDGVNRVFFGPCVEIG